MKCLDDKDESIRLRALDLISKMVTKTTLMEIVQKLLENATKTENQFYRNELVLKLIQMCAQSNYVNVTNFEWYLNVLLDLSKLPGKFLENCCFANLTLFRLNLFYGFFWN